MGNKHAKALRCNTCQRNMPSSCFKFVSDKRYNSFFYEVWACKECQGRKPAVLRSLVCPSCGVSFKTMHPQKIYCTTRCEIRDRRPARTISKIYPKECAECGEPFYGRRPHAVSCSLECQCERDNRNDRERMRKKRVERKEKYPLLHWASLQKLKAWKDDHPERVRIKQRLNDNKRLAAMTANGECTFTEGDWANLLEEHNYRCFYCFDRGGDKTRDHIVPLAKGGTHTWDNIVPSCPTCNSYKSTMPIEEFLEWIHNKPEWPPSLRHTYAPTYKKLNYFSTMGI